jgi:hypothetical protein
MSGQIDTYAANEAMRTYAQATYGITAPSTEGTITDQAHNAVEHCQKMFHKYLDRIDTSKYTPEGVQDVIAQFAKTDAGKGFEAAVARVEENRAQAAARVEHLRRELSPAGDTATELRNTRYWDSTLRILDNVKDPGRLTSVAEELISKADRTQLGVLLNQLGPYMQARSETIANLTPENRRRILDGYTQAIEAATDKVVPEYAKSKRRLSQAEKVSQITKYNADSMRKLFTSAPGSYRPVFVDPRQYDPDSK